MSVPSVNPHDEVWGRLAEEEHFDYLMYCFYRDMGLSRELKKAWQLYLKTPLEGEPKQKKSQAYFSALFIKNRWEERCRRYDAFIDRVITTGIESQYIASMRKLREEQLDAAKRMASSAVKAYELAIGKLAQLMPAELTVSQAARFLELHADLTTMAIDHAKEALAVEKIIEHLNSVVPEWGVVNYDRLGEYYAQKTPDQSTEASE